jgi:hypothetical protein
MLINNWTNLEFKHRHDGQFDMAFFCQEQAARVSNGVYGMTFFGII